MCIQIEGIKLHKDKLNEWKWKGDENNIYSVNFKILGKSKLFHQHNTLHEK